MKMNLYVQPILTIQDVDAVLMASMSLHDEIGDGQLSKETMFVDEEAEAPKSVWDE